MYGVGLKPSHYADIFAKPGRLDWYEAISENFMDSYGRAIQMLERVRADHPVGLHGVSLSVGSADGVSEDYLGKLAELIERVEPFVVSDHLCFTGIAGRTTHDLLPLVMAEHTIRNVVENVDRVQERLGRTILLENISTYVRFQDDELSEPEFVAEIIKRSGCGLLLDVNNVIVNAFNHGLDARDYLDRLPLEKVGEIHVAGHSKRDDFLFDDHKGPTPQIVWELLQRSMEKVFPATGPVPILIEWDTDIPSFEVLAAEADTARRLVEGVTQ